jgi:hypothetical protein
MSDLRTYLQQARDDEKGHVMVGVPSLVAAVGAIVLAVGAASDSDWAIILGGVVLGVGIFVTGVARHRGIDYEVYTRLDNLEK